ncbi:hypothetical protein C8R42DRAFT_714784 [Lentinula raphanica]|nr:hypothetical protein C8R42DRAFT_714784 [Lentinula raphanica]
MSPFLSLPHELHSSIIEYIAYNHILPISPDLPPQILLRHASSELLVLSVANRQLRQACLPFLFAYIEVRHDKDAKNLKNHLALFTKLTKFLFIGPFDDFSKEGNQILSQNVSQFEQLHCVELHSCRARTSLLRTLLAHPTVTSILVHRSPPQSMCDVDLSKVIRLEYTIWKQDDISPSKLESQLTQGMSISRLNLMSIGGNILDKLLESRLLSGLKEIRMQLDYPVSCSSLSALMSTHSRLNELWLLELDQWCKLDSPAPLMSSFIQEACQQGLENCFDIERVGLRRGIGQPSQEWFVIGLSLDATYADTSSLLKLLVLLGISFPKLEFFHLLLRYGHDAMHDIDDLRSVLAQFPSLRVLYLTNVFRHIDPESIDRRAHAKSKLLLLTSILAKRIRTLDSFYINEMDPTKDSMDFTFRPEFLKGWIHVLNDNRDVGGTLEYMQD